MGGAEAGRWHGYQAVGVAFASGHVLTYRSFRGTGGGEAERSVWIHHPRRGWRVLSDGPGGAGRGRLLGPGGETVPAERTRIDAAWAGGSELTVRVSSVGLAWVIHTDAGGWAMRALNGLGRRVGLWTAPLARRPLSRAAALLLGCGELPLEGLTPSGAILEFVPEELRAVAHSVALLEGRHLGAQVLLRRGPTLDGVRMPRCGVFLAGTERVVRALDLSGAQSSCE